MYAGHLLGLGFWPFFGAKARRDSSARRLRVTGVLENSPVNTTQLPTGCQPESLPKPARRRSHKATQPQLLTCRELDGRTSAAKAFDRLVADIESDLSGSDRLSAIEGALVKGFAGAAVTLHHLNTQLALGQQHHLRQLVDETCRMAGAPICVALWVVGQFDCDDP